MKKSLFYALQLVLLVTTCYAQIQDGKFEISASGTAGSYSYTSKTNNRSYDSDAITYLNTSIKLGYYITGGLEIEPELYTLFMEKSKPSFVINGNVLYNFNIPETKLNPFLLLGYGLGNAYPLIVFQNAYIRSSDKFDVGCFNTGLGLKYFFNDNVGIRVEYRYQKFSYNDSNLFTTSDTEYNINTHSVLFGFSILL